MGDVGNSSSTWGWHFRGQQLVFGLVRQLIARHGILSTIMLLWSYLSRDTCSYNTSFHSATLSLVINYPLTLFTLSPLSPQVCPPRQPSSSRDTCCIYDTSFHFHPTPPSHPPTHAFFTICRSVLHVNHHFLVTHAASMTHYTLLISFTSSLLTLPLHPYFYNIQVCRPRQPSFSQEEVQGREGWWYSSTC